MAYHYSRKLTVPFDEVISRITENLRQQGFAVIATIDVRDAFKKKLAVDFRNYEVLFALHPEIAYKAISLESHAGVMLPCHILVQEHENGEIEVSAMTPMETIDRPAASQLLMDCAEQVDNHLRIALDDLHRSTPAPDHAEALPTGTTEDGTPALVG